LEGFATGEDFGTFKDSGFGSVSHAVSFKDWDRVLVSSEDGSVTEDGDSAKIFPGRRANVTGFSGLVFSGINVNNLVIEPHMGDGHPVLGQSTGFIGTDSRSGTESLDGFQVLNQTVFLGHSLSSQSQANGDGSQKTFWDVSDDNTDEEDNSFDQVVSENKGKNEETDSEEYGDSGNDMDEMFDFSGDWGITCFESGSETGDSAHNSVVTAKNNDTGGGTFVTVGTEESDVSGFQWVFVGEIWGSNLWFRFSGKGGVINFHTGGIDNSDIGWDSISTFDENDVSDNEFFGENDLGGAVSENRGFVWNHVFEGVHDVGGFLFLEVREDTGDDDDGSEDDSQVKIIFHSVGIVASFDCVSDETENSTDP